ncbi:MAG TPA: hypothetical protein VKQ72_11070 [Aggregatilineales bacterium]|nr:hypothetical protein [Aggregatilineales bacterium]
MPTSDLIQSLASIGAIQFGRFESRQQPGTFAPIAINLRMLTSYPDLLKALSAEIAPMVARPGMTRLLAMPSALPLATAITLYRGIPLVYPSPVDPGVIEGAYDTYVPTVLLTDVLSDGTAELALAKRVYGLGLHVKAVVSVIDLGLLDQVADGTGLTYSTWCKLDDRLSELPTLSPSMRAAVERWLDDQREENRSVPR